MVPQIFILIRTKLNSFQVSMFISWRELILHQPQALELNFHFSVSGQNRRMHTLRVQRLLWLRRKSLITDAETRRNIFHELHEHHHFTCLVWMLSINTKPLIKHLKLFYTYESGLSRQQIFFSFLSKSRKTVKVSKQYNWRLGFETEVVLPIFNFF